MIFIGDIAHPWSEQPHWAGEKAPWKRQPVIANLEGTVVQRSDAVEHARLFNTPSILNALKNFGVEVVSLANNHALDWVNEFGTSCQMINDAGLKSVGAGIDEVVAARPAKLQLDGQCYLFLAFGWETIQCLGASQRTAGVNPLDPRHVLQSVKYWRAQEPDAQIILLMHWNYEMELYPQPAHRQLAFAAIDAGANAIIGHHPHRVGGLEFYKDRPIAYSVGNWWLPQGVFLNGKLKYSEESRLQLALEWSPKGECICHWFTYDPNQHKLHHEASEAVGDSARIHEHTPFDGMSHSDYRKWFVKHRIKRKALPVYWDYRSTMTNMFRDGVIKVRHLGIICVKRIVQGGR